LCYLYQTIAFIYWFDVKCYRFTELYVGKSFFIGLYMGLGARKTKEGV